MARTWSVTEATERTAFLSDDTGEDVAVLERLPDELFDSQAPLSGEDWQAMVDLVAAAPELLAALRLARNALNVAPRFHVGSTDSYEIAAACDKAISKSEGRSE
jgi:hypothetical protein